MVELILVTIKQIIEVSRNARIPSPFSHHKHVLFEIVLHYYGGGMEFLIVRKLLVFGIRFNPGGFVGETVELEYDCSGGRGVLALGIAECHMFSVANSPNGNPSAHVFIILVAVRSPIVLVFPGTHLCRSRINV